MSLRKKFSIFFTLFIIFNLAIFSPVKIKGRTMYFSQYVRLDNGTIRVASKYKQDCDLWIDFAETGINSIMGISDISFAENSNVHVSPDLSRITDPIIKAKTDWIGPYIVKANKKGDSHEPAFTGGWHGMDRKESQDPTARTLSWKAYANSMELVPGKVIGCQKVDIYVTNLIQAFNSSSRAQNKEVLKETIHYCIENRKISVSTEITALEDITISKYYGLQVQDKPWMDKVFYPKSNRYGQGLSVGKNTSSGKKRNNPGVTEFMLYSKDMRYGLVAQLDRNYGLGSMKYVSSDKPCAFTVSYGKTYYNLINGIGKVLLKGQKLYWRGAYSFI